MKNVCNELDARGVDISRMTALDFFARKGDWQTSQYARKVKKIYAWEIEKDHETDLIKNLPHDAKITIGDSFSLANRPEHCNIFDLIVFDNPMNCYADKLYCEHFEALTLVPRLLKDSGVVIFNVKLNPYNLSIYDEWKNRRDIFYNVKDASDLSLGFIKSFYVEYFKKLNYEVDFLFTKHRKQEKDLHYVVTSLRKNK